MASHLNKLERELDLEDHPFAYVADKTTCASCGENKSTHNDFYKNNKATCKRCILNERRSKKQLDRLYLIASLIGGAKHRAKAKGLDFNLTPDDIHIPSHCPVLGLELATKSITFQDSYIPPNSPTLDRIDNSKGYTPDNVCVISWRANKLKSDSTPDELRRILAYVEGRLIPN